MTGSGTTSGSDNAARPLLINIAANFGGQASGVILSLVAIPIYISLVGMESFGLIGVSLTVQGILRILDFGLTPSINRQMARYAVEPDSRREMRDFAKTCELLFGVAGLVVGFGLVLLLPSFARHWLNAEELSSRTIGSCAVMMGVLCGFQWPISFYRGGLMGLERQILCNGLRVVEATLSYVGGVLVLVLIEPTIETLFLWQVAVSTIMTVTLAVAFRRKLPATEARPTLRFSLVKKVWHFAAGMTAISITALVMTHVDKVVISKLLTLTTFGYYTLAVYVAGGVTALIITPIFNAMFPRFSSLTAVGDEDGLRELYHLSLQMTAVCILPVVATLSCFADVAIMLWTRNPETTRNVSPLLSVYIIGTGLNGLMNAPYALQLATGNTRLPVTINFILIAVFVPAVCLLVPDYGALACAWIWTLLMALYLVVGIPITHRYLLKGETYRSWTADLAPAFLASVVVVGLGYQLSRSLSSLSSQTVATALSGLTALTVAALCSSRVRKLLPWWTPQRSPKSSRSRLENDDKVECANANPSEKVR